MAVKPLPTPEQLRQLLRYDPETGNLYWRERQESFFRDGKQTAAHNANAWNSRHAGTEALATDRGNGYRHGCIFGVRLYAHRAIVAMQTGVWADEVDHIDHDRSNNRWTNLRHSSRVENSQNVSMSKLNKSGHTGVHFDAGRNRWTAYITIRGERVHLGRFYTKRKAIAVRKAAEVRHGFHENHGSSSALGGG